MPSTRYQHPVSLETIQSFITSHISHRLPKFEKYWDYYRCRETDRQQSRGPITGFPKRYRQQSDDSTPKELVLENDIAWRIHTLGDFMFGKPLVFQSLCEDKTTAKAIETLLNKTFEENGGIGFFQDLTLLGSIYGFSDILLKINDQVGIPNHLQRPYFQLELIEAPRSIALLDPNDYRKIETYVVHYKSMLNKIEPDHLGDKIKRKFLGSDPVTCQQKSQWTTQVYSDCLTSEFCDLPLKNTKGKHQINRLGQIPIVHIQNLPQPFHYEGLSEVEPLIPLQDELNIRLSDRANRVTFQAFKMYLAKGVDGFTQRKIGPGQMWETDNLDAKIDEFGGDSKTPSEDQHIDEIRQAMDKASAVTAVSAGILRGKIGHLSSENALRITMLGLLAKTERKRVTYGKGLSQLCELILHAANVYGVLKTTPEQRKVMIHWPSPLPENNTQKLKDAALKLKIGVPQDQVLKELGY